MEKQKLNNFRGIVGVLFLILVIFTALDIYFFKEFIENNRTKVMSNGRESKNDIGDPLSPEYRPSERKTLPPRLSVNSIKVPILMYHHIGPLPVNADAMRKDLTVSPEDFEKQVKWLRENGYVSLSLLEVYQASQKKINLPKKPIVFTFDDGYADVFSYAVPILRKYEYTGSFGIITGFVGTSEYATWAEIKQAQNLGMEIVSHTESHFDGASSKYSTDYIYENLTQSRKDLYDNLGITSRILIYPYGHFTGLYVEEAKKAGFVMALTVSFGVYVDPENLYQVPRVRVHGIQDFEKFKRNLE